MTSSGIVLHIIRVSIPHFSCLRTKPYTYNNEMCNVLQIIKRKQTAITPCDLYFMLSYLSFFLIDIVPSVLFIPYLKSRVRANTSECKAE